MKKGCLHVLCIIHCKILAHVFCEFVRVDSFDNLLSVSSFLVYLSILRNCLAKTSRLFFLSYFLKCFSRNLQGPCLVCLVWSATSPFENSMVLSVCIHIYVVHSCVLYLCSLLLVYRLVCFNFERNSQRIFISFYKLLQVLMRFPTIDEQNANFFPSKFNYFWMPSIHISSIIW